MIESQLRVRIARKLQGAELLRFTLYYTAARAPRASDDLGLVVVLDVFSQLAPMATASRAGRSEALAHGKEGLQHLVVRRALVRHHRLEPRMALCANHPHTG